MKHCTMRKLLLAALALIITAACNKKEEDEPFYEPSSALSVTAFRLKSNLKVMKNLDSVFFSIDPERSVIFNADSLPKGTDISKLVADITYSKGISAAVIDMEGGSVREGSLNYLENPTDSIDFTGNVFLSLTAQDAKYTKVYKLMVNVHKMDPDSLWWDESAKSSLPSRMPAPVAQKTVEHGDAFVSLIRESDGSFTLARCPLLTPGEWTRKEVSLPADADIRSFTATGTDYYLLDGSGSLYSSADAGNWSDTGAKWSSITGPYANSVVGLRIDAEGRYWHTSYPALEGFTESVIDEAFPVRGASNMCSFTSEWLTEPMTLLVGGVTAAGNLTSAVWSFDGSDWAELSSGRVDAAEGYTLIPYLAYRKFGNFWKVHEYSVWLLMGGRRGSGEQAKTVYISYDNGVTWSTTASNLGMPDYIPAMAYSDAVLSSRKMSAELLPESWSRLPSKAPALPARVKYEIDDTMIIWECPYIFLFGGEDGTGSLYDTVWKGVLNRLSFKPLI